MIYSMFAMILLTFIVGGYLFKRRFTALKSGEIRLSSFRLNNNPDIPSKLLQAERNFSNLFEVPLFFYSAGAIAIALHIEPISLIILSWLFVLFRAIHSFIHLTSNNVLHRMKAFMAGNACVLLSWGILVWEYTLQHPL